MRKKNYFSWWANDITSNLLPLLSVFSVFNAFSMCGRHSDSVGALSEFTWIAMEENSLVISYIRFALQLMRYRFAIITLRNEKKENKKFEGAFLSSFLPNVAGYFCLFFVKTHRLIQRDTSHIRISFQIWHALNMNVTILF